MPGGKGKRVRSGGECGRRNKSVTPHTFGRGRGPRRQVVGEGTANLLGRLVDRDRVVVVALVRLCDFGELLVRVLEAVDAAFQVEVLLGQLGDVVVDGVPRALLDRLGQLLEPFRELGRGRVQVELGRRALDGGACLARDRLELSRERSEGARGERRV